MCEMVINGCNSHDIRIFSPLLTDLYQVTMAYAYWKSDCKDKIAVFDLYFRKNPFGGEYAVFSGLNDCIKMIQNFNFEKDDIEYLRKILPNYIDQEFFKYLENANTSHITLSAVPEGTIVFPKLPLISLEGPLPIVQLLETSLLNFVNYASLVTTNAARYRIAAGKDKRLLEFGLRRAQGPDGGLSASKYCYIGGFDATSNLLAGKMYGIPVDGTHSHAFVSSYINPNDLKEMTLLNRNTNQIVKDFSQRCLTWRAKMCEILFPEMFDNQSETPHTNLGEFTAFVAYAFAFPDHFLALVDTYDVMKSGIPNFCAVALALNDMGYHALGIRIDSGDLAYLSKQARVQFQRVAKTFNVPWFGSVKIVASNDLNEETLHALNAQDNEIDCYGIGTHLVTCQRQPALGCVYKLVEVEGKPRMKLSQDVEKMSMPGKKNVYRLYGKDDKAILDLIQLSNESQLIEAGTKILCRHPFQTTLRTYVNPSRIEPLMKTYWKNGKLTEPLPDLIEIRNRVAHNLDTLRSDHKRHLNPTPYKVSVTDAMFNYIHKLWEESAPIGELS